MAEQLLLPSPGKERLCAEQRAGGEGTGEEVVQLGGNGQRCGLRGPLISALDRNFNRKPSACC